MKNAIASAVAALAFVSLPALADDTTKTLNDYLVDISGGTVSAGGLVGLDGGVTQIETTQDILVALQPLTSGDSKKAFGLAITPARTSLTPMSGSTYLANPFYRLLGNLTLSYARNTVTASGTDYKTQAYSIGTVYYFRMKDDPVQIGNLAFVTCAKPDEAEIAAENTSVVVSNMSDKAKQAALEALTAVRAQKYSKCIDAEFEKKTLWNASKASLSYGTARIDTPDAGRLTLAQALTLNVQIQAGDSGLVSGSLRSVRKGLELSSLGSEAGPTYKNSTLVALRYTFGDVSSKTWRGIAEVSNSKARSPSAFNEVFMYALGIDKKMASGMWLELRVGRNRSIDSGKEQTAALLNLNIVPSLMAFKM